MPLWVIAHTPTTFSNEEKQELAKAITTLYTKVQIPAFYVNVQFLELAPPNVYVGGDIPDKYAGITIHHIARAFDSDAAKKKFLDKVDSILTPRLKPKNMNWEYFIQQAPGDTWRMNGIVPPPTGSELEKEWLRRNKPVGEGNL